MRLHTHISYIVMLSAWGKNYSTTLDKLILLQKKLIRIS